MTLLDAPVRPIVRNLLRLLGEPVTVTLKVRAGDYGPEAGLAPATPTTVSTHGYETSVRGGFSPTKPHTPDGKVGSDTKFLLPGIDFTTRLPRQGDGLATATEAYRVHESVAHKTGALVGLLEVRVVR